MSKVAAVVLPDMKPGERVPLPEPKDGEEKLIRVACEPSGFARPSELEHFQGELKTLYRREFKKLAQALHDHGFFDPIKVWKDPKTKKKLMVDGHQRHFVLRSMLKHGWKIEGGKVPVDFVLPRSATEAREMILLAASQYGTTTEDSVAQFIQANGLDWATLKMKIDLPQLNMGKLEVGWFDADGKLEKGFAEHDDGGKTEHKCPQCGFEF